MKGPRFGATPERTLYALIAALSLVIIYIVAFIVSNASSVKVSFVFFSGSASLILVMLVSTLLGLAAGIVLMNVWTRTSLRSLRQLRSTPSPTATSAEAKTEKLP